MADSSPRDRMNSCYQIFNVETTESWVPKSSYSST